MPVRCENSYSSLRSNKRSKSEEFSVDLRDPIRDTQKILPALGHLLTETAIDRTLFKYSGEGILDAAEVENLMLKKDRVLKFNQALAQILPRGEYVTLKALTCLCNMDSDFAVTAEQVHNLIEKTYPGSVYKNGTPIKDIAINQQARRKRRILGNLNVSSTAGIQSQLALLASFGGLALLCASNYYMSSTSGEIAASTQKYYNITSTMFQEADQATSVIIHDDYFNKTFML